MWEEGSLPFPPRSHGSITKAHSTELKQVFAKGSWHHLVSPVLNPTCVIIPCSSLKTVLEMCSSLRQNFNFRPRNVQYTEAELQSQQPV